ncbi:MAG: hypothetical protein COU65_00300 [Candidatus Pacebacteria bacterium CG10_big_fil_rev_8_21_14_0_10_42_12]|nr:hypothetical protein [Candidatus Paceibacterota bacterium]PIR63015.1 MAG: hypothetical protein COU65_00300 [Candidatus Pacebacteria bacterium CG10_big_fil_rev_8_21_14_0_10_42_12]
MEKARSRLTTTPSLKKTPHLPKIVFNSRYLQAAPIGLLGLCGLGILVYLLKNIAPESIANIPIYRSYGPLVLTFLFTSTLVSGFVLLNIRRGFMVGISLTLILLLKLQKVQLSWPIILTIVVVVLIIEIAATYIRRVIKKT